MNPKIEKLEKEIEKTKTKIAEMQAKLHKLDFLKSQQAAPSETVLPQEKEDVHEA